MVEESNKNTLNKQKLLGCQVEVWSVVSQHFLCFREMVVGLLNRADRSIDILKTRYLRE